MPSRHIPNDRFRRQASFAPLGKEGQAKLESSRVAIVGMGALGSAIAERLIRMGIGYLRLIDRDWVELDNLPRQTLYTESDVGAKLPKAIAAEQHLLRIDSQALIEAHVDDLHFRNAAGLLQQVDLIMDGTDNFETRYLINDYCLASRTPWIPWGLCRHAGQVMAIVPGVTCCFRCLVPWNPDVLPGTCDTLGVLGPAVTIVASYQCIEAIKLLVQADPPQGNHLLAIDAWHGNLRRIDLRGLQELGCPSCRGDFPFLDGKIGSEVVVLCGKDSIQIRPPQQVRIDLLALEQRWKAFGPVEANRFLVRVPNWKD